jgi:hypothetical protein
MTVREGQNAVSRTPVRVTRSVPGASDEGGIGLPSRCCPHAQHMLSGGGKNGDRGGCPSYWKCTHDCTRVARARGVRRLDGDPTRHGPLA